MTINENIPCRPPFYIPYNLLPLYLFFPNPRLIPNPNPRLIPNPINFFFTKFCTEISAGQAARDVCVSHLQ